MKTCEKCAVTVSGNMEKCPLCHNTLAGEGQSGQETFPFIPLVSHEHGLFFRILQLCSAVAVILSVTINLMLPQSGVWSLFVVAGMACLWISLIIVIQKRHNILKNLTYQVTAVSILSLLWDVFTGWRGWSIDYVIPISFVVVMAATAILARVFKMKTGDYMIYIMLLMIYGIIPVVFVFSGLCAIIYPSLICVACSLFSLAALLIFEGKNMVDELKRRLHL